MQDPRIRWAAASVAAVIACFGGASLYAKRHAATPVTITDAPATAPGAVPDVLSATPVTKAVSPGGAAAIPPSTQCFVHVAGAVRNPGLYQFAPGSRVAAAILAAGGGTSKADIDALNLAEPIGDGEKIYVPERHEDPVKISRDAPGNSIGHVTIHVRRAPRIPSAAALPAYGRAMPLPIDASAVASGDPASGDQAALGDSPSTEPGAPAHAHAAHPAKIVMTDGERININTASASDLERLPGVGPATAAHIIDFRTQNGGFHTIEDLTSVKGIGEKKLAKLAPFVTL